MLLWTILLLALPLWAEDWARFRGPNGSGVDPAGAALPHEFGPAKNVVWQAKVPFGRSSPILAGGKLFLTASDNGKLVTLAFDAATGKPGWRRELTPAHNHKLYKANDSASPTPAADEKNVYVFFPDFGLVAYSHAGQERWRHPLGPFQNFYGMSSSPVVAGGLVMLLCDQVRGSFLLALDKDSGKPRWKTERPGANIGWSVPIVHDGQVLVFGTFRIDSYYLATGESRWWMPVGSMGAMGTPVVHGDTLIVAASGSEESWLPPFEATMARVDKNGDKMISAEEAKDEQDWAEHFDGLDTNRDKLIDRLEWNEARALGTGAYGAVAIPLNGKGKLEPSAVRWRLKRNLPYVPAPVLYDGVYYMVKDGGIVSSLDPATGAILKQGRAAKAPGQYLASPVAADGKIYMVSEEGKLTVLKAGAQWEELAMNDLAEECYATPAIAGGRIYVRTRETLYSFAAAAGK